MRIQCGNREFSPVQLISAGLDFQTKLGDPCRSLSAPQADEAAHPVETVGGKSFPVSRLPLLHGSALAQGLSGQLQRVACDVDHCDLKVRVRKIGIQIETLPLGR